MALLIVIALLTAGAFAPRYGADSRPGFSGRPDWRNRGA